MEAVISEAEVKEAAKEAELQELLNIMSSAQTSLFDMMKNTAINGPAWGKQALSEFALNLATMSYE